MLLFHVGIPVPDRSTAGSSAKKRDKNHIVNQHSGRISCIEGRRTSMVGGYRPHFIDYHRLARASLLYKRYGCGYQAVYGHLYKPVLPPGGSRVQVSMYGEISFIFQGAQFFVVVLLDGGMQAAKRLGD